MARAQLEDFAFLYSFLLLSLKSSLQKNTPGWRKIQLNFAPGASRLANLMFNYFEVQDRQKPNKSLKLQVNMSKKILWPSTKGNLW